MAMCKDDEHEWSNITGEDRKRCVKCGNPALTLNELAAAVLFRQLFKPVPLTEVEKLPDPDYGL